MATVDSTTTLAALKDAYADNAGYAEDGSIAKARAFITVCRILKLKIPAGANDAEHGGITLNVKALEEELARAQEWLALNGGQLDGSGDAVAGARVKHYGFEDFRK